MAYDNVGKQLYVTTDAGRVQVFNLPERTTNGSIQVGTNLRGIDISPDRTKLVVGNSDGGRISIISLPSREVTHYPLNSSFGSGGTTSCAFIDNNRLVVGGRVLDIATGVFSSMGQSFYSEGIVAANASRSAIAFTEPGISSGVAGTYYPKTATRTSVGSGWFTYDVAVSPSGNQIVVPTYSGSFVYDKVNGSFTRSATIGTYASWWGRGAAYSPYQSHLFVSFSSHSNNSSFPAIVAYNSQDFSRLSNVENAVLFQSITNSSFAPGHLRIASNGRYLFALTSSGVRIYDVSNGKRSIAVTRTPEQGGVVSGHGLVNTGTTVNMLATPNTGWLFSGWKGSRVESAASFSFTASDDAELVADFQMDLSDADGDQLTAFHELTVSMTDPDVPDSDGDDLNDGQEVTQGTNPLLADTDGDTYSDGYEVRNSSDPKSSASFPTYTLTLTNNGTPTGGTVTKSGTLAHGTSATVTATPSAGYLFGSWSGDASGSTNPFTLLMDAGKTVGATFVEDTRDPDDDGLTNYQEFVVHFSNPTLADTDGDGVNDGEEVMAGINPIDADSDSDGLNDGEERNRGTNPLLADTDGDTYSDGYEVLNSSDPTFGTSFPTYTLTNDGTDTRGTFTKSGTLAHGTNATLTALPLAGYLFGSWSGDASGSTNPTSVLMDSDKTVRATFVEDTSDPDEDGLSNYQEIIIHLSNPNLADTDGDGVEDGQEVTDGTGPRLVDSDADDLSDGEEKTFGTDPLLGDTDNDGYEDGTEVRFASDPKLASSFPTVQLNLVNDGNATGGVFRTKAQTVAFRLNAFVNATPFPGYLFSSWTGDASGSANPFAIRMDSDKTVGATFVEDTRDPDGDELTNYQEIIVLLTDPNLADTDDDGVNDNREVTDATNPLVTDSDSDGLNDGEEKERGTNPLSGDSDGDGLGDLQEESLTSTNPLAQDSDGNGTADAYEDPDQDGILNGREVNERGTNPKSADSDDDGLSDTYERVFKGTTDAFKPRIGDRIRFDLRELGFQGSYKLVGKLPVGMTFNATTGVLGGKLTGKPATSALTIQILEGATVVRSIPLSLPVGAFPTTLTGSWQALLEDANGLPQGLVTATLSSPGKWSATLDVAGSTTIRKAAGTFDLDPAAPSASVAMTFPAATGLSAQTLTLGVSGPEALADGTHPQGTLRGFRLARGAELPTAPKAFTMVIDQGEQDGFLIPAGIGWATGVISTKGGITLSGQLGDAEALKGSMKLGATGQALLWLKPYRNLSSRIGGVVSLHETGGIPATALAKIDRKLWWYRATDAAEPSYPAGFAAIPAEVGVRGYTAPATSIALSETLGLTDPIFRGVVFEGGGLPDPNAAAALPDAFALDPSFKLIALPIPGRLMAAWQGSVNTKTGGFSGTFDVAASTTGIVPGKAAVSGVLFPSAEVDEVVGAGLVKIPVAGKPGAFRTGAVVLSR
jgi:hypothetical protein